MGLRQALRQRGRARRRPTRIPAHLQSPPRPHRAQGRLTSQSRTQPPWGQQLGGPAAEVGMADLIEVGVGHDPPSDQIHQKQQCVPQRYVVLSKGVERGLQAEEVTGTVDPTRMESGIL